MSFIQDFFFAVYPYLCASVFVVGCTLRFKRDQYSWQANSSQILGKKGFCLASNLFHLGMLGLLGGHVTGLLVPVEVGHRVGMTNSDHQYLELVSGSIVGTATLAGLTLLIHRRVKDVRVARTGNLPDLIIACMLWATLVAGLTTLPFSYATRDTGEFIVALGSWAQHIVTFRSGAPSRIVDVPWIFKFHMVMGMTIFMVFPFTRLVHIGSAPILYLLRDNHQIVRRRSPTSLL